MAVRSGQSEVKEAHVSLCIGTFIAVTGPPGSGKASLVNRVIQDKEK